MGVPATETLEAAAETPHVARIISSDSVPAGGFTSGTILASRYRIIGLLGRGGMGEVYRADDLKLGQPVALKFLPPRLAEDPVRRERFFAEVRITRQLSHPNICRVYDIGEIDGRHFLSMEFIDGEDLASLLKRIGHLTNEKALDIARQLAAGLAAAHERGVLHRDLKPANIMLDGHGRVRITDFGLAIAVEDESQATEIAGTPAYMAPEQLAGKGATVRSDMYSLGLVLYEIYTGKKAFNATNLAQLREQKETQTPRAPSEIREGIDPVVERLIQRCMERDPVARPSSVAQLALALPGGDPLAAALAAGETPSPEMVAAFGSKEGLRPAVAWALLAFIVLGMLATIAMKDRFSLHRRIPFEKPPDVLVERSRAIIKKAGYPEKSADSAYGFSTNSALLLHIKNSENTADRWKQLDAKAILFWYRQSPRRIVAQLSGPGGKQELGLDLAPNNPPLCSQGEALVVLDTEGHLISLRAVPVQMKPSPGAAQTPDWSDFFAEAGLDSLQWTPTEPQGIPPFYADTLAAWQGSPADRPNTTVRIEGAALQGKPIYFEIINTSIRAALTQPSQLLERERRANRITGSGLVFLVFLVGVAVFLARRNLRLGRGDRRNAARFALIVLSLNIFAWIIIGLSRSSSAPLFYICVAGLTWVFYIAVEPFARRRWPHFLVSWVRLLSGDWRDPLVARDALIGSAFGILVSCFWYFAYYLVPSWLGYSQPAPPARIEFSSILGARFSISALLSLINGGVILGLFPIIVLLSLRVALRSHKAALAASIIIAAGVSSAPENSWLSFAVLLVISALWYFVLIRFGLVAGLVFYFSQSLLVMSPMTMDASAWYAGYAYAAIAIFATIVLYAFRFSLGGHPLLAPSRLDE